MCASFVCHQYGNGAVLKMGQSKEGHELRALAETLTHTHASHLLWAWCRWRRSSLSLCWLTHFQIPHWWDCSERSRATSRSCSASTAHRPAHRSSRPRGPSRTRPCLPTRFRNIDWSSRSLALRPPTPTHSTGCCWPGGCWLWQRPASSGGTGSRGYLAAWPAHGAILREGETATDRY